MITKTCYLNLLFLILLRVCLCKSKCCSQQLEMLYFPGAGITHVVSYLMLALGTELGSLGDQYILSATKPFLQPHCYITLTRQYPSILKNWRLK